MTISYCTFIEMFLLNLSSMTVFLYSCASDLLLILFYWLELRPINFEVKNSYCFFSVSPRSELSAVFYLNH